MDPPLLLIHFNRPDITRRAIQSLEAVKPSRVWILCDAARPKKVGEAEKVASVRNQLENLRWPCEVRKLYREENLGCFRNISDGISWFLQDCGGEGIILEDDCIADPSFFRFCTEMLERYREDPSVYAICGHNRSHQRLSDNSDYLFSNYFECWGWATWARAWKHFDPEMNGWRNRKKWKSISGQVLQNIRARLYWDLMFRKVASGKRDSWAYRYLLSIWANSGKCLISTSNLTENIGFQEDATHSKPSNDTFAKATEVHFPLTLPNDEQISPSIDRWFEDHFHSKSFVSRFKWFIRRITR